MRLANRPSRSVIRCTFCGAWTLLDRGRLCPTCQHLEDVIGAHLHQTTVVFTPDCAIASCLCGRFEASYASGPHDDAATAYQQASAAAAEHMAKVGCAA